MGVICFFMCLSLHPTTEKTDRIIVQFKKDAKESYLSHVDTSFRQRGIPVPGKTERLVRDHIIAGLKKRNTGRIGDENDNQTGTVDALADLMVFSYDNFLSQDELDLILDTLNKDPEILYAEPDAIIRGCYTPDDEYFSGQWNMVRVSADRAWDYTTGSSNIVVAVLDSGVDYTHPDLWQNIGSGYDFVNDDDDPYDDHYPGYHGTHITGIIAARGNNVIGVAGINWNVTIMPLKILDSNLEGYLSDGVEAIDYAISAGCDVINASLGTYTDYQTFRNAIIRARNAGIIVVAAAGNGGSDAIGDDNDRTPFYPSAYEYDNILAVANSMSSNDALDVSSNYGLQTVDLAAPGMEIYSTFGSGVYNYKYGTSIATPHVTGAVALLLSVDPDMGYREVIEAILDNVDPVPSYSGKIISGGRLNIERALLASGGQIPVNTPVPEPAPQNSPEPVIDMKAAYRCGEVGETAAALRPNIRIINMEPSQLVLQNITVRYFYTKEGTQQERYRIDNADIDTSLLSVVFSDGYFDIGFTHTQGEILFNPYSELCIELTIEKTDGSRYDQTNDYSFDPSYSAYRDFNRIAVYYGGDLLWGVPPAGNYPAPTAGPETTPSPTPLPTETPLPGAGHVRIAPEETSVFINEHFSVEVRLDSGTQKVAAYGIDISYTPGIISVDTEQGDSGVAEGADGFIAAVNVNEPGIIKTSGFDTTGSGPGRDLHLLTLYFIAGEEAGSTPLSVTIDSIVDENTLEVGIPEAIGGNVTVFESIRGDVNGSNRIDITDALIVAQYYVGLEPASFTAPLSSGDADCSGKIDIVDALLIARYYVGIIEAFCQ